MNLPEVFFPAYVCPHDKAREIFVDCGKHIHVDIADAEEQKFKTQTLHPGSKKNLRLSATTPTLPLAPATHLYVYPFVDRVSGKLLQKRSSARDFVSQFPHLKYRISKEKTKRKQQKNTAWFSAALNAYKEFRNDPFVPSVNAAYTGGCLACAGYSKNDEIHLVHATGQDFDILRLVSVTPNTSTDLLEQTAVIDQNVDSQIFEVVSSRTGQSEFCAVRKEFGYELFELQRSHMVKIVSLDQRTFTDERLTSLALSPYISGEVLVATENGSLHLISPGESAKTVKENWLPRFECFEPWRQCYFAAHPRQFVTADRTVVKLFDSRTKFEERVDLFALPNKLLRQSERVMVAKQQTSCAFHHIVATDASMFIIDQRFPGHPLSHWSFSQKAAPQYISSCDISVSDDIHTNIIIVGTQHPPETYCFQIQFGGLSPLQTTTQPWRLSRISDFSKFEKVTTCADMMLLQQRFKTSLAGVAVCSGQTQHSFHAFQSTGILAGAAINRAGVWLQRDCRLLKFVDHCSANPDLYDVVRFNCGFMIIDLLAEHLTHVLCPLCTPESDNNTQGSPPITTETLVCDNCGHSRRKMDPVYHGQCSPDRESLEGEGVCENCGEVLRSPKTSPDKQNSRDREFMEGIDRCENCGHSLKMADVLYGIRAKDCIVGGDSVSLDLFNRQVPHLDQVPQSSPNTQILTKLWRGETDILDLLAAREEERKKKKEETRKKRKAEKKGDEKKSKEVNIKGDDSDMESTENSDKGVINQSESDPFDEEDANAQGVGEQSTSAPFVHEDKEETEIEMSLNVESLKSHKLTSALSSKPSAESKRVLESRESVLGFYAIPSKPTGSTSTTLTPVTPSTSASPMHKTSKKDRHLTRLKESELSVDTVESRLLGLRVALMDIEHKHTSVDATKTTKQSNSFKSPDVTKTKHTSADTANTTQDKYTFKSSELTKTKQLSIDATKTTKEKDSFKSADAAKPKHTSPDTASTSRDNHVFKSPDSRRDSKTKRRRHSSSSSDRSVRSNSSHVGFLGTPPRLKKKDSLLDLVLPDDDDESLELFTQFDTHSFIASTLPRVSSPGFSSPTNLTKGFQKRVPLTKSRKKHITGF
ncbi:uncharacterized protein LOC121387387 [Gigantopelta aegis]|uniref:uncharacterized protein LOC121387387 n=1 Tax=Gigantopelta aegis TaxID=1735272 RepID=UPI001B889099|nr:uncharacterized protein LOC121387387 [Gigantopelta aegis]